MGTYDKEDMKMRYVGFHPTLFEAFDIMFYEFEFCRKFPTKANKDRYRAALEKVTSIASENGNGLFYTPSYRAHRIFVKQWRRINRKHGRYAGSEYWVRMISQQEDALLLCSQEEKPA